MEDYSEFLWWVWLIIMVLKQKEDGRRVRKKGCNERSRREAMQCGVTSQGIKTTTRSWTTLGDTISHKDSRRNRDWPAVRIKSRDTKAGQLASRTLRWWIPIILSQGVWFHSLRHNKSSINSVCFIIRTGSWSECETSKSLGPTYTIA